MRQTCWDIRRCFRTDPATRHQPLSLSPLSSLSLSLSLSLSSPLSLSHLSLSLLPLPFYFVYLLLNSVQKRSFKRKPPLERFVLISFYIFDETCLWWLWFLECISSTKIYNCCHRLKLKFPAASKAMVNRASTGYLNGNTSKMLVKVSRVGTAAKVRS